MLAALILVMGTGVAFAWYLASATDDGERAPVVVDPGSERTGPPSTSRPPSIKIDGVAYRGPEATDPNPALQGRVVDAQGGPLAGVTVKLSYRPGAFEIGPPLGTVEVTTAEDGTFAWDVPDGARLWNLVAELRAPGYIALPHRGEWSPRGPIPVTVTAHRLDLSRTVRVIGPDERPVVGATIRSRDGAIDARTDAVGRVEIPLSRSLGPARVEVRAEGFATTPREVRPWDGRGPLEQEVLMQTARNLTGTVTDEEGTPIPGVQVFHFGWVDRETATDTQGGFAFHDLPSEESAKGRLTFRHRDYLPAYLPDEDAMTVQLSRGRILKGRVLDAGRHPLGGATVSVGTEILLGRSRVVTEADGTFSLMAPNQGGVLLRVTYPGLTSHLTYADVVDLPSDLEILLERGITLTGRITDESGMPIPGANVTLSKVLPADLLLLARSDADGRYRIHGAPWGKLHLRVTARDFQPYEETIEDAAVPRDAVLVRGVGLTGRVEDDRGQPVTGFRLAVFPRDERRDVLDPPPAQEWLPPGVAFTGAEGRFTAFGLSLRPGAEYRIEIRASGFALGVLDPYVARAGAEPLVVRLAAGCDAVGRVVDERGNGIAKAEVSLATHPAPATVTDEDGAFRLASLPKTHFRIAVSHPAYQDADVAVDPTVDPVNVGTVALVPAGTLVVTLDATATEGDVTTVLVESERISLEKHLNREGRLRLEGIPEGSHRVRLRSSRADLDGLETDVRIERGREQVVMFRASPPLRGEIVGRVTVDGKEPRTPVEISLARIGSSGERTPLPRLSTGNRGTFSLNDLEPGTYYAEATVVLDRATYSGGTTIELGVGRTPVTLALRTDR